MGWLVFLSPFTGIFSYTSTWVLGVKSPGSPIHVGGSGIFVFILVLQEFWVDDDYLNLVRVVLCNYKIWVVN
jgi:hypothetical protein